MNADFRGGVTCLIDTQVAQMNACVRTAVCSDAADLDLRASGASTPDAPIDLPAMARLGVRRLGLGCLVLGVSGHHHGQPLDGKPRHASQSLAIGPRRGSLGASRAQRFAMWPGVVSSHVVDHPSGRRSHNNTTYYSGLPTDCSHGRSDVDLY
jgi:hypothetical protein